MMQQQVNTLAQDVQRIKNSSFFKIQQINENITLFLMKRYPDSGNKPSFSHESAELYVKNLLFSLNQLIEKEKKNNQTQKTLLVDLAKADVEHLIKISKNVKYNLDDILSNIDSSTFDSASNHSNEKDNSGRVSPKY